MQTVQDTNSLCWCLWFDSSPPGRRMDVKGSQDGCERITVPFVAHLLPHLCWSWARGSFPCSV